MSQATSGASAVSPDQQTLTHLVYRLLKKRGGDVDRLSVEHRVSGFVDLASDEASKLLDEGQRQGLYTIEDNGSEEVITNANPVGPEPDVVTQAFGPVNGTADDLTQIDGVDSDLETALKDEGYDTVDDLVDANVDALVSSVREARAREGNTVDHSTFSPITTSASDALHDAGLESKRDICLADPETIAEKHDTLTQAKAQKLQQHYEKDVSLFPESDAKRIVRQAEVVLPNCDAVAKEAISRYTKRSNDSGTGEARVRDFDSCTGTVGDPIAITRSSVDPTDPEAQYMAGLGSNESDPVPTGFQVLEDTDYDLIPRPETHPDAGDDALPVDDDGNVIPPTVPDEPRLQMPLDELIAKKLGRGIDAPVRVQGPPGSGKNLTLKFLCWYAKRGYRSIDVGKTTTPDDLFGPITPDEDGVVKPRNGAVKQGLLNGDVIVINEFPTMQAGVAMELHRLLNEGRLLVKSHGELITPHPAARIVITMNPPTKEFRDTEPLNRATRGRFRGLEFPYPDSIDDEVAAIDQQVNSGGRVVGHEDLRKIVQFAHETRDHATWPTISTRNLTIVCEHIADGASPQAALKNELWAVAEPNQNPEAAHESLDSIF
jgi:nitric oxide reductase NorQ protein